MKQTGKLDYLELPAAHGRLTGIVTRRHAPAGGT